MKTKDLYAPLKAKPFIEVVVRADTAKRIFRKSKAGRNWKFKHWAAEYVIVENAL